MWYAFVVCYVVCLYVYKCVLCMYIHVCMWYVYVVYMWYVCMCGCMLCVVCICGLYMFYVYMYMNVFVCMYARECVFYNFLKKFKHYLHPEAVFVTEIELMTLMLALSRGSWHKLASDELGFG